MLTKLGYIDGIFMSYGIASIIKTWLQNLTPKPFKNHKMEVSIVIKLPPNGWFIKENPIEMNDLGVPLFQETSMSHYGRYM